MTSARQCRGNATWSDFLALARKFRGNGNRNPAWFLVAFCFIANRDPLSSPNPLAVLTAGISHPTYGAQMTKSNFSIIYYRTSVSLRPKYPEPEPDRPDLQAWSMLIEQTLPCRRFMVLGAINWVSENRNCFQESAYRKGVFHSGLWSGVRWLVWWNLCKERAEVNQTTGYWTNYKIQFQVESRRPS